MTTFIHQPPSTPLSCPIIGFAPLPQCICFLTPNSPICPMSHQTQQTDIFDNNSLYLVSPISIDLSLFLINNWKTAQLF